MKSANDCVDVVIDEGSSQIKMVWMEDGEMKKLMIKSRAQHGVLETNDGGYSDDVYETDGMTLTVGDRVMEPTSTTSDHYQTSNENRVLVHHALRMAGFGGRNISIIVTLPVDTFFRDATKRSEKRNHILKAVRNFNGLPLAVINNVRVAPEAAPVLDSFRLDEQGNEFEEYEHIEKVLIVDIGGTTTDITVVNGDNSVEKRLSVKRGVFNIANNLKQAIFSDSNIDARDPSANALDIALRTKVFRGKYDVRDHVKAACQPVIDRLLSEMNTLLEDPDEVDFICYVGGGANLLAEPLSRAYGGNTITHSDPEFAVAVGLMKNEIAHAAVE